MLTIFLVSLSNAAIPFQVSSSPMQIEYPKQDYIKQNDAFRFHVHVINETMTKTNKTTACFIHLYNRTGYDISTGSGQMEFEDYNGVDFAYTVNGGNFSHIGSYSYVIQCNSSDQIAFASSQLYVNQNGREPTIANITNSTGLLYLISVIILVIGITFNNNKWLVKTVLMILGMLFLILAVNNSMGFVVDERTYSIMLTSFIVLIAATSFMFIVMVVYYFKAIAEAVRDARSARESEIL